ncbi:MAG TPA: ACP S-malonyltransferase [Thermomicrobiales bacterium]|nr:ACP S-malonyltransferase [Thermomicrobiales bacterium]
MAVWQSQPYALVFPGQGAQFVGMGATLIEESPAAAQTVREADEILGVSLSELMANGPADELEDTYNAQPAILTISVAALRAVESALGDRLHPAMVAGHSLGEFSALVAAGVLDFPDALRLVRERGRIMKAAGETSPGAMAAVLGLDDEVLAEVCREASNDGGEVVVANRNCPGQTVISGDVGALERASELAKERGAKRVARLGVSIASHSPLMADAAAEFGRHVAELTLADPQVPVVANGSAQPMTGRAEVAAEISAQMAAPVDWTGSVQTMRAAGIHTFVELGPGAVIAGLIKRIDREAAVLSIADLGLGLPSTAK